jgi:DNA-binding transcriptional ArsR family regulator
MRNRSVTYSTEAAFEALADPTRRAVLDMLRHGNRRAGQIAKAFPISRPAISKHLRLLRRAHLVSERREGRNRVYQINPEPLQAVDRWLEQYRVFWHTNLNNLKAFVETQYAEEQKQTKLKSKHLKGAMKSKYLPTAVLLVLAATSAFSATEAQKSFDSMRALQGSWTGTTSQGTTVKVTFRITGGDSAIMSEIEGHGPQNMVSMFHMDGPDKLLMTHYCGAGNQPRMTGSASPDGKTLTFTFLDASNLAAPDAGHMQKVVFSMPDADHHVEDWTFLDHGKEIRQVFDLKRTN